MVRNLICINYSSVLLLINIIITIVCLIYLYWPELIFLMFVHLGPVSMKLQTSGKITFSVTFHLLFYHANTCVFFTVHKICLLLIWPCVTIFAAHLLWPKCPWGSWLQWSSQSLSWHCTCTPSRLNLLHASTSCGNYRYLLRPLEGIIWPCYLLTLWEKPQELCINKQTDLSCLIVIQYVLLMSLLMNISNKEPSLSGHRGERRDGGATSLQSSSPP